MLFINTTVSAFNLVISIEFIRIGNISSPRTPAGLAPLPFRPSFSHETLDGLRLNIRELIIESPVLWQEHLALHDGQDDPRIQRSRIDAIVRSSVIKNGRRFALFKIRHRVVGDLELVTCVVSVSY